GGGGYLVGAARLQDFAQDGAAVDIQMVEGIPGPGHLKILVEHNDRHPDVIGRSAVDVDGALCRSDHGRLPIGQTLDVVRETEDGVEPPGDQLRIYRVDVRLPHDIAGQVDLAQDVQSAARFGRILIAAQKEYRTPRYQTLARIRPGEFRLGHV